MTRSSPESIEALRLLAVEDARQVKLHELLETIREQIRLEVPPEHRPEGLFQNIQDAVYAMRGRTPLMNDAAITSPLRASQPAGEAVAWRVKNDHGHWYATASKAIADTWRDIEKFDVQPLYLATPSAMQSDEGEKCQTCDGGCEVGGFDRGDNAYRTEPCPECASPSSAGTEEHPHVPAAFINAIAEEGTKAEAIEFLQKQWNETCALRAELKALRGVAQAEINPAPSAFDLAVMKERDQLRAAAERVCWFDWSDNDMDAVAAIDTLRKAITLPSTTRDGLSDEERKARAQALTEARAMTSPHSDGGK